MITALAADDPEPIATGGIIRSTRLLVEREGTERWLPLPAGTRLLPWLSETRDDTIPLSSIKFNPEGRAA